MRNVFLEKSGTKYGEDISPRLFFKKSKLSISLDQQSEVSYSCVIVYPRQGLPKHVETKVLNTCFHFM